MSLLQYIFHLRNARYLQSGVIETFIKHTSTKINVEKIVRLVEINLKIMKFKCSIFQFGIGNFMIIKVIIVKDT